MRLPRIILFVLFVCLLPVAVGPGSGTLSASMSGSADELDENDIRPAPPVGPMPIGPPPPREYPTSVPEYVYPSTEQARRELVETVDLHGWNADRLRLGLEPLQRIDTSNIDELLRGLAEVDVAAFDVEIPLVQSHRSSVEALHRAYESAAALTGFLDGRVNEDELSLDIWTKDPKAAEAVISPEGSVRVHQSQFSLAEAEAAAATLRGAASDEGLRVVGHRIDHNGLVVSVADARGGLPSQANADRLVTQRGQHSNVVVRVEPAADEPFGVDEFCGTGFSRRCDMPAGGVPWSACTSGYAVRDPADTQRGVSSAGHCSLGDLRVRGHAYNSRSGTTRNQAMSHPLALDVPAFDGRIGTLATSQSGTAVPTYYRDLWLGNQAITTVSGTRAPGTRVCLSGRNSDYRRCGEIVTNTFSDSEYTNVTIIDFDAGPNTSDGGDSGAPYTLATDSQQAVLIHSGRADNLNSPYYGMGIAYYAHTIDNYLGGWRPLTASSARAWDESFVARLYQAGLGRSAPIADVNWWANNIGSASNCVDNAKWAISHFLVGSGELDSLDIRSKIRRTYWAALNRAPDQAGEDWWYSQIYAGLWTFENFVQHTVYGVAETTATLNSIRGRQRGPC